MTASFVHLRLHTEFSLVDGLVRVKPLIKSVAAAGMPAVAVTDMSNMCSLVKFYKAAMGGGIKPICGADIWLASADEDGPLSRMTLLAMNAQGYRNLTELVSRGWSEGQSNDLVIIQRDWVKDAAEGLIALSGAREGEVGQALLARRRGAALGPALDADGAAPPLATRPIRGQRLWDNARPSRQPPADQMPRRSPSSTPQPGRA